MSAMPEKNFEALMANALEVELRAARRWMDDLLSQPYEVVGSDDQIPLAIGACLGAIQVVVENMHPAARTNMDIAAQAAYRDFSARLKAKNEAKKEKS